jgi:predicted ester cyclase
MSSHSLTEIVMSFLEIVRAGRDPDAASRFLAPVVLAHQLNAEGRTTIRRTPAEYSSDRVFVRWRQTGRHLKSMAGERPTGAPLVEIASVVYRLQDEQIVEYWIHLDRLGMQLQVEAAGAACSP